MTRSVHTTLVGACPDLADRLYDTGCCILWIGSIDAKGYGRAYPKDQTTTLAHRIVYQRLHGDVDSLAVDHLCYVRSCVNPEHLEAVAPGINVSRAAARRRQFALSGASSAPSCCGSEAGRRRPVRPPRRPSRWREVEDRLRARREREAGLPPGHDAHFYSDAPDFLVVPLPRVPGQRQKCRVIDPLRMTAGDRDLLEGLASQDPARPDSVSRKTPKRRRR